MLDGDDYLEPSFIEEVSKILYGNPSMIASSSWMHTFGVLDAIVRPTGGGVTAFLSRNCCPATHMFRREVWQQCGGYDENMRSGFEDWDFFLNMLEAVSDTYVGIVEKPLINYRTTPASSNIKSMEKRLEPMRYIIEKHINIYKEHVTDAILGIETISISRLYGWESEMIHSKSINKSLNDLSNEFIKSPSYGDGGMAASVICEELEQAVHTTKIRTHASITAKPFFERRGYKVIKEQQVIRSGIFLTNYAMEKLQMQIIDYFTCDRPEYWLCQIKKFGADQSNSNERKNEKNKRNQIRMGATAGRISVFSGREPRHF